MSEHDKGNHFDWERVRPQLPLNFGVRSNGEHFHLPDDTDRKIGRVALEMADRNAKRAGLDRRAFLATSAGLATTLSAVHLVTGCSNDTVNEVACDLDGAREALDPSGMFLMDVQTHHIDEDGEYNEMWKETNVAYATAFNLFFDGSCPEADDHIPCLGRDDFVDLIFGQSDLHVGVLSTFPALTCEQASSIGYPMENGICGDFLPTQAIADTRDLINEAAGSTRMLAHAAVMPNPSTHLSPEDKDRWISETLRGMESAVNDFGIRAWKCYTPFGPLPNSVIGELSEAQILGGLLSGDIIAEGWWLDDEFGQAMIEQARALDAPLINVHKGVPLLSFNPAFGSARDIGIVANKYPDVTFLVYHSALNFNPDGSGPVTEGAYHADGIRPEDDPLGINSLVHSVVVNGLSAEGKGSDYTSNVVAELGGPGARAISRPEEGTHIFGKLLKYIGENNIVWGTDAIWGGSPQALMEGFMAFQMDEAIAEANDYPMLTDDMKAKILGLNAARIYGVDVDATRCELADDTFAKARHEHKDTLARQPAPLRPRQVYRGPRSRREFLRVWGRNPNFPS